MELLRNKNSGKHFIYIQSTGNNEALMVTPEAEIKSLNVDLFEELNEMEENDPLLKDLISESQLKRFDEYMEYWSDDNLENLEYLVEQLSPHQKKKFLGFLKERIEEKSTDQ